MADAELMVRTLRVSGLEFTAHYAVDRGSFRRELADFSPHLVLSDYEMPRYSGMEALADVQERSPATPVIIVTDAVGWWTGRPGPASELFSTAVQVPPVHLHSHRLL